MVPGDEPRTQQPARAFSWRAPVVALAALAVLLAVLARNAGWRAVLAQAIGHIRPGAVLVTLPGQALAILLCVFAQQALRPGVGFAASLASRLVRDATNNLPLMPPGPGDAVGARVLVLAGGSARAALSVRALDILAELLGQLPYMVLAFLVLARLRHRVALPLPGVGQHKLALIAAALALLALGWLWWRNVGRSSDAVRRLRGEARLLAREIAGRRRGMPVAVALHGLAWGISGVQIWLAARVLGLPLTLFGGVALESAASSARVLLFFIPGGLVMQEAGIVGAGLVFGLAPAQALALALVLRLRDVVFGLGVLVWPAMEWRARRALSR